MKFVREIPEKSIEQKIIDDLSQQGFTLVWTRDSVELWYEDGAKEKAS